eukprot:TRINITY_DN24647_c0_g1_i1.p1 TRINITY_DN24647_c0_g1~~TRINITY_DN24647_c0_g1_i1.p1  ORF type:complete len:180 (-),score=33.63 TRINITY_DN24647_c0_g1_i1:271-810(-)
MPAPNLTLAEVLKLQAELYSAFSDEEFQDALEELEARHGKAYMNYTDAHTQLFLTVQNKILPKYGFSEGQAGVLQMLRDVARFNDDEQFCDNRSALNDLIGMAAPVVEDTESVAAEEPHIARLQSGSGYSSEAPSKCTGGRVRSAGERQSLVSEKMRRSPGNHMQARHPMRLSAAESET